MVALPRVEIPGYAEALRRERELRDTAFLGGLERVAGVTVRQFCLRHLLWLETARNGFVVPCIFDSREEMLAHALQVLWFCRPEFTPPKSPEMPRLVQLVQGVRQQSFIVRTLWRHPDSDRIPAEVEQWLGDAFMDAPAGSSDIEPQSHASTPAMFMDKLAEAGLPFTYDEVMDMPMRRLWQHWRLAVRRLNDAKLTNPSDELATAYLAAARN